MSADRVVPHLRTGLGTLALVTSLLVSCGGDTKSTQAKGESPVASPIISSFSTTKVLLTAGESIQLTAAFSGGTAMLSPGNLAVESGVPLSLSPTAPTVFVLTVKNTKGEVQTAQIAIDVVPAPQITTFTASPNRVNPGEEAILLPQFSGGTALIQPGDLTVTSGQTAAVRPTADTTYTLTVTNAAGRKTTAQSAVKVMSAPVIASFDCATSEIQRGQSTQLRAIYDHGTAHLQPGNIPIASGVPLTVSPLSTTLYSLTVTGPTGLTSRAEMTVPVVYLPVILRHPANATQETGELTTFTAEVEGSPTPSLQWERSHPSTGTWNPVLNATEPTLSVIASPGNDKASFRLTATNRLGTATSQPATLTVTESPRFVVQPVSVSIREGQMARFTAQAIGTPRPTIQWQRSVDQGATWSPAPGAAVLQDGQSVYAFSARLGDDKAHFRAMASNKVGQATSRVVQLSVTAMNGVPTKPVATADANQLARPNRSLGWTLTSTDPDNDTVSFHLTSPASPDLTLLGNRLTYSPLAVQPVRSVTIVAKDNKDGVSESLLLTLPAIVDNEPPARPTATADPSNSPREQTTLGWTLAATDPDSDPVSFQFASTPPTDLSISGNRLLYKPVGEQPARTVDVVAKDPKNALSLALTLALPAIRANGVPAAPIVVPAPGNNPHVGRTLTWTLGSLDPDNDPFRFELQPGAGSEVTISGSTLRFTPMAAQATRKVAVIAMDSWSSSGSTEVQLPAITTNNLPRWHGDDLALTHSGNGTGAPLEGQPYTNQAPDRSALPGGQNLKQTQAWPAGPGNEYFIPLGTSLTWDAANLQNTYSGGVCASDPDASDTLFFSLQADTASPNALPATMTIDQQGVVRWTPSPDQVGKAFILRLKISDGLGERTSTAYPFYVRDNQSPVITSRLRSDGWVDPYATGDQTLWSSGTMSALDPDLDTVRIEPVQFSDPNVGIQHFSFTPDLFQGVASNLRLQLRTFPGSSFDRLAPFVPQTLTYRARDTWDGVSTEESVVVQATGRARFSRFIQNSWPGGFMIQPEAAQAWIYVPSETPAGGFLPNLSGSWPFSVMPDPSNGLFEVRGLKAPGYFVVRQSSPFTESSTWPFYATWRNDGGTGASVGTDHETVIGSPGRTLVNAPMTAMTAPPPPSVKRVLFTPDGTCARTNEPGSNTFVADAMKPFRAGQTHFIADLHPQMVIATDGTISAPQTAHGLKTIVSVQPPPFMAGGSPGQVTPGTPFNLVWRRDLFDAALRGGNDLPDTTPLRQVAYAAQGFRTDEFIAPTQPTLQEEWELLQGTQTAWDSLTLFHYQPDPIFMLDASGARKALTLTGLTFDRPALPDHQTHYVALFGERIRVVSGSTFVPYSVGVRSMVAFSAGAPVTPVIGPVSNLRFTAANRGTSKPAQTFPAPADQVLDVPVTFGSAYDGVHVQWSAPALGTAAEYEVDLYDASRANDQPATPLARWITPLTALELPVNILPTGKNLILRIRAKSAKGRSLEMGWADACRRIRL